jgi:acyl-CoA thioester hydrolase
MQVYQKNIIVRSDDLDELHHVNNVRYVQWVQDMAEAHWKSRASTELLHSVFWVLIEHHIQYKGEAQLDDTILAKTYVEKSEGVKSQRVVEMHHKESHKLLVRSVTTWCLMDRKTRRPLRINQEIQQLFQ